MANCERCLEEFEEDFLEFVQGFHLCEDCLKLWTEAREDIDDYTLSRMMKFWRLEGDPLTIGD